MLLGALFGLAGMGSSSAAIVLPSVANDLGVDVGVAAWTISLYVLMLAVTTAMLGLLSFMAFRRETALERAQRLARWHWQTHGE